MTGDPLVGSERSNQGFKQPYIEASFGFSWSLNRNPGMCYFLTLIFTLIKVRRENCGYYQTHS